MPLDRSRLFGFLQELEQELSKSITIVAVGGTALTLFMSEIDGAQTTDGCFSRKVLLDGGALLKGREDQELPRGVG
jgi:hypothetical protein